MKELLKVSGLWGGYTEGVDILRGIDMTVREGEAVGIIGLNGSGKSTLGKAVMNMLPYRRGEVFFDGENVSDMSTHELAGKGLSIMLQGGQVFPNLSVWDNLELAFADGLKDSFDRLRSIIPLLQIPGRKLRYLGADKLSGGQKHQLALAMTLAKAPRFVILDEPSAGLSPKAVEEMFVMLKQARELMDLTVLLIEQNVARAHSFCGNSLLVKQGIIDREFGPDALEEIDSVMF